MDIAIKEIISKWNHQDTFSGIVTISEPDGIIYQNAFGYRNRAEALFNEPDTAFAIASGTKLFTALAVCKLIDGGYLSLGDRVWDLISHDLKSIHKWDSLAYYLPMFNELPKKFKPGERFGYSNAGFILLGLVVESVSRQIYQQYVRENIILPLGLFHTGFYLRSVVFWAFLFGRRAIKKPIILLAEILASVIFQPISLEPKPLLPRLAILK